MTDYQLGGIVLICLATMLSIFKYLDFIQENKSWNYLYSGFVRVGRGEYQLPKVDMEVLILIKSEVTGRFRYDLASMDGFGKWVMSKSSGKSFDKDKDIIIAWAPLREPFDGSYP